MTGSGIVDFTADQGAATCRHIIDMLAHLTRHPRQGGPEVLEMEWFWHPRMNWYGPAGIGTGRGIDGFRKWHQIPFLNGMLDRGLHEDKAWVIGLTMMMGQVLDIYLPYSKTRRF